jgi:hypothetical protein
MAQNRFRGFIAGVVGFCGALPVAAGPVQVNSPQPTLDRWMYPFNSTPGIRIEASTFASPNLSGFDDRDAQFLIGFDTATAATPGLGAQNYVIHSVRIRATISQGDRFAYDPTFDSVRSSYDPSDPLFEADADSGKPIEIFGCGYRNGFGAVTTPTTTEFCETCVFGGQPVVPPAEGARNVFPAIFDNTGVATDVSRHVRQHFEAAPMAIGKTGAVQPAQLVPANTELIFDISLCDPATRTYFQRGLNEGRLNLLITSLHAVTGPGSTQYPVFYTKENPLSQAFGYAAKLELVVNQGLWSDLDNDGVRSVNDFVRFINLYAAADGAADVDQNCQFNVNDFVGFLNLYAAGR